MTQAYADRASTPPGSHKPSQRPATREALDADPQLAELVDTFDRYRDRVDFFLVPPVPYLDECGLCPEDALFPPREGVALVAHKHPATGDWTIHTTVCADHLHHEIDYQMGDRGADAWVLIPTGVQA